MIKLDHLIGGFVVAAVLTVAGAVGGVFKSHDLNPPASVITVAPKEEGVAYNVLAFCNDPATTVGKTPMTDAPAGGNRYIALRGTESINWPDSPVGVNPSAVHYYINSDPTNGAVVGEQLSTPVEMTKDAAACFYQKAGK